MRTWLGLASFGVVLSSCVGAAAGVAVFDAGTDAIEVAGQSVLGSTATFEAVVLFPTDTGAGGFIFNEWTGFQEDKQFYVGPGGMQVYAYPRGSGAGLNANPNLSRDVWHHVAFVADTSEERIYVDGALLASRSTSGEIGDGAGLGYVGAIPRDGACQQSFVGWLDSLRISDVVRYSGESFEAPSGDLTSDENTVLLYNFNDPPGSATVVDDGPLERTGTLGAGCQAATSPELGEPTPTTTTTPTTSTTMPVVTTTTSTTTSSTPGPAGVCGDPVDPPLHVAGRVITASDALSVLRTAVGLETCELCVCDVDDSGTIAASDALTVLKRAVGQPIELGCPACS